MTLTNPNGIRYWIGEKIVDWFFITEILSAQRVRRFVTNRAKEEERFTREGHRDYPAIVAALKTGEAA